MRRWHTALGDGGLAFSSGLDSCCLLVLSQLVGGRLTLFTQGSPETWQHAPNDDVLGASAIAQETGTPFHVCQLTTEMLELAIVDYIWHTALPMGGFGFDLLGGAAFHGLCRDIAQHCDVVYCGEGADELFLGYHQLHVDVEPHLSAIRKRLQKASPALRDWSASHGLLGSPAVGKSALRRLFLKAGMAEYHLPSVNMSASAWGMRVATPFLDRDIWALVSQLDAEVLLDTSTQPAWTKLPLRRFLARHAAGAGMQKAVIRRKRAMGLTAAAMVPHLMGKLLGREDIQEFYRIIQKLFIRLHVEPGYTSRPGVGIREIIS